MATIGLSTYNPIWDQTRRDLSGRTYQGEDLLIASNFECGNGYNIRKRAENRWAIDCEPDPGTHIYSGKGYYFCFGVWNQRNTPRSITIEVVSSFEEFAYRTRFVILKRGDEWSHLPDDHILTPLNDKTIIFTLDLPANKDPNPVLFLSNYHWYPYTEMTSYLKDIVASHPEAHLGSIGKTFLGRDLWAIKVGPKSKDAPTMVCAQTPQPSEMGHYACRAILDYLISDEPKAVDIRSRHCVCLIPHTNPDGTVMGYGVSDAQGNFPYFEAHKAFDDLPGAAVEQVAIWKYLEKKRPWLFIEWHSNHWSRRPGHMLLRYDRELICDKAIRRLWDDFERRLDAIPNNFEEGRRTNRSIGYKTSMGVGVATKMGGIPIMIKQHDKYPLDVSRQHAIDCFLAAIEVYDQAEKQ